jgi:hypothetical protein
MAADATRQQNGCSLYGFKGKNQLKYLTPVRKGKTSRQDEHAAKAVASE